MCLSHVGYHFFRYTSLARDIVGAVLCWAELEEQNQQTRVTRLNKAWPSPSLRILLRFALPCTPIPASIDQSYFPYPVKDPAGSVQASRTTLNLVLKFRNWKWKLSPTNPLRELVENNTGQKVSLLISSPYSRGCTSPSRSCSLPS